MMISKTHFKYAKEIDKVEAINHPQTILGLNAEKVLEFWLILDKLSKEQLEVVEKRYQTLHNEDWFKWSEASDLACKASRKIINYSYDIEASHAAYNNTNSFAALYATCEIIGGVESPVFLPMFDNL